MVRSPERFGIRWTSETPRVGEAFPGQVVQITHVANPKFNPGDRFEIDLKQVSYNAQGDGAADMVVRGMIIA